MRSVTLAVLAGLWLVAGCRSNVETSPSSASMPSRDINAVLKDHTAELMAIPGVAGVYVGALNDGQTLCLKVMVVKKSRELVRRLPKSLEGYQVLLEETGPIRPLRGN